MTAKPIDNLGDIVPNLHSKPIEIALLKYSDPRNLNIHAIDIPAVMFIFEIRHGY